MGSGSHFVRNESDQSLPFQVELALDDSASINRFVARIESGFSPWRRGLSTDTRELGFALFSPELTSGVPVLPPPVLPQPVSPPPEPAPPATTSVLNSNRKAADFLFKVLGSLQRIAAIPVALQPVPTRSRADDSLGIIIPERGGATFLPPCLAALETALAMVSIRTEVVVVINGSSRAEYAKM